MKNSAFIIHTHTSIHSFITFRTNCLLLCNW